MHRIALTGNIASGKSSVAAIWQRAGAHIVDADVLAREAVRPGAPALEAIAARFGPDILEEDGSLDRDALRRVIFQDEEPRRALEAILHPAIHRLRVEHEARLEAQGVTRVVHVIPLLFEVGLEDDFDEVVLVDAPDSLRLRRIVEKRGLPEDEARRMLAAQLPASRKRSRATLVIDNDGSFDDLEASAVAAWKRIRERGDA